MYRCLLLLDDSSDSKTYCPISIFNNENFTIDVNHVQCIPGSFNLQRHLFPISELI
jgi:hypothetical protein